MTGLSSSWPYSNGGSYRAKKHLCRAAPRFQFACAALQRHDARQRTRGFPSLPMHTYHYQPYTRGTSIYSGRVEPASASSGRWELRANTAGARPQACDLPINLPEHVSHSRRRQLQLQPVPPPRCRGCGHPRALFTPPPPALPSKGSDRSVTAPTAVGAHQPPPTTSPRPGRRGRLWRLPPPALPSNGADRLGLRRRAPARARCRRSQSQSLAATAAVTSRRSYRRRRYCHTPCGAAQPEQACNCWSALAAR